MSKCKLTAFGLLVRTELLKRGTNQAWLEKEVTKRTGLFVDNGYMYKILTGQRAAPKVVDAIRQILNLPGTSAS